MSDLASPMDILTEGCRLVFFGKLRWSNSVTRTKILPPLLCKFNFSLLAEMS